MGSGFDIDASAVLPVELCDLRDLLECQAKAAPERDFVWFGGGQAWSCAGTPEPVRLQRERLE